MKPKMKTKVKPKMKSFILILFILLLSPPASAKLFRNSYVNFELPPNWKCKQEGFEHVCVNAFSKRQKEAIIILTAKKRGPQDSLKNYHAHLKEVRKMSNYKGVPYKSIVKSVRQRKINGVNWIDGIQLGSEVQTYYTRYAAAIKDSVGILVSFSAHKDHYSKYSSDFIKAIQSLKVTAPKELSQLGGKYKYRKRDSNLFDVNLGDTISEGIYGDLDGSNSNASKGGLLFGVIGKKGLIGVLLILIVLLGAFIYIRSNK